MRRLQEWDRNVEQKTDVIDIIINVCRYGALAFAFYAVYLMRVKEQHVLWPAIVAAVLLVGGLIISYIPKKIETSEGKKDRKNW